MERPFDRRTVLKGIGSASALPFMGTTVSARGCEACSVLEDTEDTHDRVYYGHPDEHSFTDDCIYHGWEDRLQAASVLTTTVNSNDVAVVKFHCDDNSEYLGWTSAIKTLNPTKLFERSQEVETKVARGEWPPNGNVF